VNHNYSLRAYSRDLELSPGFLSDVLRASKNLSPHKGREIFSKLGLFSDELDYIEQLIILKSSEDHAQREEANTYIQLHYNKTTYKNDESKVLIMQSAEHFLIYGITRCVFDISHILDFAQKLGITKKRVFEILNAFQKEGYIQETEGLFKVVNKDIFIRDHNQIISLVSELSVILGQLILNGGGIFVPERLAHCLVLGLDHQSFELVSEAHKHYIKNLHRISEKSKSVDRFVFITDLFLMIEQVMPSKNT
jgi:hypothetical protein